MKDYYYILGVKKNATSAEIKKAYRKLSFKFHPDKNEGDEFFTERFKEIQEAHEILSNEEKRNNYDLNRDENTSYKQSNNDRNFEPLIEYFIVNKNIIEFDEAITFSWKTINSDKVMLKPFGVIDPIGKKTYKIKDFKNHYLNFELIAENTYIGKSTNSILKVENKTYCELFDYYKKISDDDNQTSKKETKNRNILFFKNYFILSKKIKGIILILLIILYIIIIFKFKLD